MTTIETSEVSTIVETPEELTTPNIQLVETPERKIVHIELDPTEHLTDFDHEIAMCTTTGDLPVEPVAPGVDLTKLAAKFPVRAGHQKQRPALLVPQNRLASGYLKDVFSSVKNEDLTDIDGKHHINISSTGETALGRFLDINAKAPFNHPELEDFQSLGGLWYFVKSVSHNKIFRGKWGKDCRTFGKAEPQTDVPGFKVIIADAAFVKLLANEKYVEEMILSTLPFKNYYIQEPLGRRKNAAEALWFVRAIEEIRRTLKLRIETNDPDLQPNFSFLVDRPVASK